MNKWPTLIVTTGALCLGPAGLLMAQDAGLEEIVVTARKREENLQATPVSVTAFSAASLERQGIETVMDLDRHVANLSMISGQGGGTSQSQISIRGVGQSDFVLTSDQSVGLYLDGVYIPRSLGAALDLVDIERIEVLRGPQGTLFGRNTTAGAVQIVSVAPKETLSGNAEVTAGSFDRRDFKGSISVPLADNKVLTRLSVASLNQDGYGKRLFQGTDGSDTDVLAARGAARVHFTDTLLGDFIVDASRKRGRAGLERTVAIDPTDPNLAFYNSFLTMQGLPPADARYILSNPNDTWSGQRNTDENDIFGASATFTWTVNDLELKSITAYRTLEAQSSYDFDGTPYPLSEQELNLDQDQVSQEVQLSGQALDKRLDWIGGVFYFREQAQDFQHIPFYQPVLATGGGAFERLPGGFTFSSFISQKTESYAGFGQATWHFTDKLSSTGGLRYTSEKKTLLSYLEGAFTRAPGTVSDSWSDVSPRLGLEYQINDRVLTYVSGSRGFRSGGFNGRNTTPAPPQSYEPETIWAYEVGIKSESDDRRLRLNAAAFYYDYSDFQGLTLDSFSGITVTVGNIAKVKLYGAELDLTARPTEALQFSLAGGYTHQQIGDVAPSAQISIRPDTRLVNAPEWTAAAGADYTASLGGAGDLALHVDYSWKSGIEFFLPNYPSEHQPGYGVFNARLSFTPRGKPWQLEAFGSNLGNETYRVFAENGTALGIPATTAIFARPREWGLRARIEFD